MMFEMQFNSQTECQRINANNKMSPNSSKIPRSFTFTLLLPLQVQYLEMAIMLLTMRIQDVSDTTLVTTIKRARFVIRNQLILQMTYVYQLWFRMINKKFKCLHGSLNGPRRGSNDHKRKILVPNQHTKWIILFLFWQIDGLLAIISVFRV